jgi:hypothetical protein
VDPLELELAIAWHCRQIRPPKNAREALERDPALDESVREVLLAACDAGVLGTLLARFEGD